MRAMSKENVEIVRAGFEAWNATVELDLSLFHSELVYHPRADEPDPSPHIGRDAYERLLRGFLESFSEFTLSMSSSTSSGTAWLSRVRSTGRSKRPSKPWARRHR